MKNRIIVNGCTLLLTLQAQAVLAAAPLAEYLTPPYSSLSIGAPAELDKPQIKIPKLSAGQSVVFYRTHSGDVKSSFCGDVNRHDVVQPNVGQTIASVELENLIESHKASYQLESFVIDSFLSSSASSSVIAGVQTSDEISAVSHAKQALTAETTNDMDSTTQSAKSLNKSQQETTLNTEGDDASLIKAKDENLVVSRHEREVKLTQTRRLTNRSSISSSQQARISSIRNQFSGLYGSEGLDALIELLEGAGILEDSGILDLVDESDLAVAELVAEQFANLMSDWGDLALIDLLDDFAAKPLRAEAVIPKSEKYDVEVQCTLHGIEENGEIYHGSSYGVITDIKNHGSPIYDVLILSTASNNGEFYVGSEDRQDFSMFYKSQDELILSRLHLPLKQGKTFRSVYISSAESWKIKEPIEESFFGIF